MRRGVENVCSLIHSDISSNVQNDPREMSSSAGLVKVRFILQTCGIEMLWMDSPAEMSPWVGMSDVDEREDYDLN